MKPRVPRDWVNETVFLIAGGSSVLNVDLSRLHGHRVVVVNSSYAAYPNADALVFTDARWWRKHVKLVREIFKGEVVTLTPHEPLFDGLSVYERQRSGGISSDPTQLAWWHTSVTTALNWIVLKGASRICILGLDGKGDWHHEPHPLQWGRNASKFELHAEALRAIAGPLNDAGVRVYNLNLDSAHGMFDFATLDEVLQNHERAVA